MTILGYAFDLEGTCVDLEHLHFQAYQDILAEYGVSLLQADIIAIPGVVGGGTSFLIRAVEAQYPDIDFAHFSERKKARYEELLMSTELHMREGLREVLGLIRDSGIPYMIGSRTPRAQGMHILEHSGLTVFFTPAQTVFLEDVAHAKPAPDVYLKTAALMGITPVSQLVFEDSPSGVAAAVAAGSPVFALPPPQLQSEEYARKLLAAGAREVVKEWKALQF